MLMACCQEAGIPKMEQNMTDIFPDLGDIYQLLDMQYGV